MSEPIIVGPQTLAALEREFGAAVREHGWVSLVRPIWIWSLERDIERRCAELTLTTAL